MLPQQPKAKLKMITLDNQANSKININISYNLTEPKNRLFTQNQRSRSGSSNYQQTVYTDNACVGKKVSEVFLEKGTTKGKEPVSSQGLYSVFSKGNSNSHSHKLAEEVSNQCEISIRMVNKRKKNPIVVTKKKISNNSAKTANKEEKNVNMNLNTQSHRQKRLERSPVAEVVRTPLGRSPKTPHMSRSPQEAGSRKVSSSKKHRPYVKTEEMEGRHDTKQETKQEGRKVVKKSEASQPQKTKVSEYLKMQSPLVSPIPTPKSGYSRRAEHKQPQQPSFKKKSDKKIHPTAPLNSAQNRLFRRLVKVSQLSYGLTSSQQPIQPDPLLFLLPPTSNLLNSQQSLMTKAATLIKSYWRQYKKTKVVAFYKQIFSKNVIHQRQRVKTIESLDSSSYAMDQEGLKKLEELFESKNDWRVNGHRKSESGGAEEEEDSVFDIRKYEGCGIKGQEGEEEGDWVVEDGKKAKKHKSQRSYKVEQEKQERNQKPNNQIEKFKQHQVQQWSQLNNLIKDKLQQGKQLNAEQLLKQLIKQTQQNKQWLQQNYQKPPIPQNPHSHTHTHTLSPSNDSPKSSNYIRLAEQRGIAKNLFKDSAEITKKVLEHEQSLIRSRKAHHRSSLSESSANHRRQSSEEFQFTSLSICEMGGGGREMDGREEEGVAELLQEVVVGVKTDMEQKGEQEKYQEIEPKKTEPTEFKNVTESISNYLDCGLNQFDFRSHQQAEALRTQTSHSSQVLQTLANNSSTFSEQKRISLNSQPTKPSQPLLLLPTTIPTSQPLPHPTTPSTIPKPISIDLKTSTFQSLYQLLLSQFSLELHLQLKLSNCLKRSFLNRPDRPPQPRAPKPQKMKGIKCNHQSIRDYLTGFVYYILKNPQHAKEVIKNINYVLGPSSREILFYLREDADGMSAVDFVEEEGYLFAIPLKIFQSYELSLPVDCHGPRSFDIAMLNHHWHRAVFESLNEALDAQRPYGVNGRPYLWSKQSKVSTRKITQTNLPLTFRSAVNRLLDLASLPCGIMFEQPQCPYYHSHLLPDEKAKINEDRISLMLADELFENEATLTNYDDEVTEVLLELSHYFIERVMYDVAVEMRRIKRVRVFMDDVE